MYFAQFIHDCLPQHPVNLIRFADNITVIGLISKGNENEVVYRNEVKSNKKNLSKLSFYSNPFLSIRNINEHINYGCKEGILHHWSVGVRREKRCSGLNIWGWTPWSVLNGLWTMPLLWKGLKCSMEEPICIQTCDSLSTIAKWKVLKLHLHLPPLDDIYHFTSCFRYISYSFIHLFTLVPYD